MTAYLVTGGAGFIGSHLVDLLINRGSRVVVVDDLSTGRRANLNPSADFIEADLADPRAVDAFRHRIPGLSGIFHLAAQTSVVASVKSPITDAITNVASTLNVIKLSKTARAPIVFASTGGAIYSDLAPLPTTETAPIGPSSPYGVSKASCELYLRMAHGGEGMPSAICRLSNVYGPRQRGDGEAGVVAIFASRVARGERCELYGNGEPTRDYIHASDVCSALISSVGHDGVMNISTGVETSTAAVLELVASGIGGAILDAGHSPLREGEKQRSCLDSNLAQKTLGWRPAIDVRDGIPTTARAIAAESAAN